MRRERARMNTEVHTDEIYYKTAIGASSGGTMKEGFSIRGFGEVRKVMGRGSKEQVSGVSQRISKAEDWFVATNDLLGVSEYEDKYESPNHDDLQFEALSSH